jgi:hypothetical protein
MLRFSPSLPIPHFPVILRIPLPPTCTEAPEEAIGERLLVFPFRSYSRDTTQNLLGPFASLYPSKKIDIVHKAASPLAGAAANQKDAEQSHHHRHGHLTQNILHVLHPLTTE